LALNNSPGAEAVKKLAEIVDKANAWAEEAEALINSSEVITLEKAKEIVDKGDALNIVCQEYRTLRNALRQARGWALRVKKMNNDESQAPINELKELIAEHNQFLVKMPEQVEQLKEMLCGYCLCRRPYDGFMVGCDSCEEWYHGPCVGLTEQQAEKCDKYVCIRCSALKQYEMCADKALFVVKKWTSPKDLQKARASENQRHQRKIREKKREQEKLARAPANGAGSTGSS
jgi:DNA-directed RNA polymerase subunit F